MELEKPKLKNQLKQIKIKANSLTKIQDWKNEQRYIAKSFLKRYLVYATDGNIQSVYRLKRYKMELIWKAD